LREAEIMPAEETILGLPVQGVTPQRRAASSFDLKVHIPPPPAKQGGGEGRRQPTAPAKKNGTLLST